MNQDFDFDDQLTKRSGTRRRNQVPEEDNLDDILDSFSASHNKPQPAPRKNSYGSPAKSESPDNSDPPQTVSGWGETGVNRNARRRDAGASMEFGQELFTTKKVNGVSQREFDNRNDNQEIPEIPDLDENENDTSEDMAFQVAEAPDVQVHQISTYKELDKEFFREKAFQFLEGNIDVSLLHCGLNTETQIAEEEDVIWEWTKLFTEVVSVLSVAEESENSPDEISFTDDPKNKEKKNNIFGADIFSGSSSSSTKRERNINF